MNSPHCQIMVRVRTEDEIRPKNPLFWTAIRYRGEIRWMCGMGWADLANDGRREFKTRWGTQGVPLIWSTIGARAPANHEGRLMHFVQVVVRNTPLQVCKAAGELLYRHFGK